MKRASIALAAIGSVSATGSCLTGGVTTYGGSTAGMNGWFVELTLGAVQRVSDSSEIVAAADVATAIHSTYRAAGASPVGLLNARVANRNDQLTNNAAAFAGTVTNPCQACLLAYQRDVYAMTLNYTLPVRCQTYTAGYSDATKLDLCIFALSKAIANFDSCTASTTQDLALGDAVTLTGGVRCSADQIAGLEGKYGIYRNIMNKALFSSYVDADFETAYKALPCFGVFDTALSAFSGTPKTNLIGSGKCGTSKNTENIFDVGSSVCTTQNEMPGPITVATFFNNLANKLGGGVPIVKSIANNANRCSASDMSILGNFDLFDVLVKCTTPGAAPALIGTTNAEVVACFGKYWSALGVSAVSTATPTLACSGCLQGVAAAMYDNRSSLNRCVAPLTSFSPSCVPQIVSNRFLSDFYSCSGLLLNTNNTVGSSAQIAAVPVELDSMIPFISSVQNVVADSTLTTTSAKLANAVSRLSSVPKFSNLAASSPFKPCYGAFAMELVNIFTTQPDVLSACSNEFDSSCLKNTQVIAARDKFRTCSGIVLKSTSPWVCTEKQNEIIIDSAIPSYIFSEAVTKTDSSIAKVMGGINAYLVEIAKITTEPLPCVNCMEDVVIGLFGLDSAVKKSCTDLAPNDCLKLPAVIEIAAKYAQCANQTLDVSFTAVPETEDPSDDDTEEEEVDEEEEDKASSSSVVLGSVLLVIGAIML
jgi:hypothetical protein